jgi:hypothetical protein
MYTQNSTYKLYGKLHKHYAVLYVTYGGMIGISNI